MVFDFAVKNDKAKCKIKDQMENVLVCRGYMALAGCDERECLAI